MHAGAADNAIMRPIQEATRSVCFQAGPQFNAEAMRCHPLESRLGKEEDCLSGVTRTMVSKELISASETKATASPPVCHKPVIRPSDSSP